MNFMLGRVAENRSGRRWLMAGSSKARKCCSMEKKRLMKALEKCEFCADDYEAFHNCYRTAARESGERARSCMIA